MLDRRLFVSSSEELLKSSGTQLRSLCGKRIEATWVARDASTDEWLPDEAVILDVGSDQLEIVFWKLDEVALTWNSIDTATRPCWVADWDEGMTLSWRRNALPELKDVVGKSITGVSIVEYLFQTRVLKDDREPTNVGQVRQVWVLNGLEFDLGEERLQVFNALDENGVTVTPPTGPEFRRIPL